MARGLKARKADDDGEEYEGLERAMEYTGVVGAELADMLTMVHKKVKALEPRVPTQHTFGGDGLQNFIRDHQEELERLGHQVENLTTMMNKAVMRLQVGQERCRAPEQPRVKPRENPEESPPQLHPVQGFSPRNMQRRWWEKREERGKRERGNCGNGHVPERKPGT